MQLLCFQQSIDFGKDESSAFMQNNFINGKVTNRNLSLRTLEYETQNHDTYDRAQHRTSQIADAQPLHTNTKTAENNKTGERKPKK